MRVLRPRKSARSLTVGMIVAVAVAALPAAATSGGFLPDAMSKKQALVNVTFRADFFHSDAHAGIFAGVEKGFWEKEGLNVTIRPGQGSGTTIQQVASGNDTFGYANAFVMAQQVVRGADVTAIAALRQVFDGGVVYWPDHGISQPRDLVGKLYMSVPGGFVDALLPLFAENSGGWDHKAMRNQAVDAAAGNALFAAKKADAISGTRTQLLLNPIPSGSVLPRIFAYSDYNIDPLGFVVLANSRQVVGYPGLMKKFVAGLTKAWIWACANPRQAVTLARENYTTNLSLDVGTQLFQLVCGFRQTKAAKGQAPGFMMLADWQRTIRILRSNPELFGSAQNVPPAISLFTNKFVDQVYPRPCAKGQKSTKAKPCKAGGYK
jgi:NitT/TauT family transport system substrate-binding protein